MGKVINEIIKWARHRPYWEQFALEKIISGNSLTDADYELILDYFLEDNGLAIKRRTRHALLTSVIASSTLKSPVSIVKLRKISNLHNVNALVPAQTLEFGQRLTVVYGDNASGKSGYARVLGYAGFTRGDINIIPDVTKSLENSVVPSADIEIYKGDSLQNIHFTEKQSYQELSSIYVFDSTSMITHLIKSNEMNFYPAGLYYLTRLAEAIDQVKM